MCSSDLNSDTAAIVKSLLERGWLRISICPCSPYLQYWIDPTPDGSNTGTASGGSTPGVIPTDINITPNYNISASDINNNVGGTINTNSNNTGQPVKIATIDSGVDYNNSSLTNNLFRNTTRNLVVCNSVIQDGIFGLNMLYRTGESPEPMDTDGHGTFINGILSNNYRAPNHTNFEASDVNLQLLNVKFYNNRASGGKLYDALCGIHYALNNGASVINVSWKVRPRDADIPLVSNAFYYTLYFVELKKAILIASAGNRSKSVV